MELDDFRRRWQQQPPGPPSTLPTEQTLQAMLTQSIDSPLSVMKRNARRDLRIGVVLLLFNLMNLIRHSTTTSFLSQPWVRLVLGALVAFAAWSFFRQFQIIRQMEQETGNLYLHLKSRIQQFRQLMRIRQYVGLSALCLVLMAFLYVEYNHLHDYLNPASGGLLSQGLLMLLGLVGLLALVGLVYARGKARRQRRYGQYLDRLEGALRELEE